MTTTTSSDHVPGPASASQHSLPLPPPFATSSSPLSLISQGAESLLYATPFLSSPRAALKYRPPKPYRHPTLDKRLTKARLLAEARVLVRCARERVVVPRLLAVGAEEGWLALEWISGPSVKEFLRARKGRRRAAGGARQEAEGLRPGMEGGGEGREGGNRDDGEVRALLRLVGAAVGRLHAAGIVHGDLTSSNMILRPKKGASQSTVASREGETGSGAVTDGEIVLIDFGLAQMGTGIADEDKAVDLYVLERAFGSTHPELEDMFAGEVLGAYGSSYKGARIVLKRLEDVRMRGRKKSMIG